MIRNFKLLATTVLLCFGGMQVAARPFVNPNGHKGAAQKNVLKGTAAACSPATARVDLDVNNVRAQLMTGGDMWWDIGAAEARYEVPKGSKKNSLFAGSCWIGGYDASGQLKVAAQTYRQNGNDYWPGPIVATGAGSDAQTSVCSDWDRFWKVSKADVNAFIELAKSGGDVEHDPRFEIIRQWPGRGNSDAAGVGGTLLFGGSNLTNSYAPFKDLNGNNIYDWRDGEYPDIKGDQFIWWVFNDVGNVKSESNTGGIQLEVQASAFAFATNDYLNDATFYNYRLINRGSLTLDSTYIATWTDADLGDAFDDYIGCDTIRGLGILYNGKTFDGSGQANSYGSQIPMVGIDFFIGPVKTFKSVTGIDSPGRLKMEVFNWFNNDFTVNGNPTGGQQIYNYMTGTNNAGQPLHNDFIGPGVASTGHGAGPNTRFVFFGNPDNKSEWSECTCNNTPYDRRFVHSSGPFRLESGGVTNDITIGAVWVSDAGGCPNTSFRKIRAADDVAQDAFDLGFKLLEGPQAPRLTIRELDRKLVLYLSNDSSSNNFLERFGYDLNDTASLTVSGKSRKFADSLYKFEGYRVFQLKNSTIQPAQIFDERGEVNTDNAIEVFQADIANGVSRIVNYTNRRDIGDSVWEPAVKVVGKDSGIVHSFEITQDYFSSSSDKRLVNYKTYYYVAIAYAYNEFAPFSSNHPDSSQDVPYIGSVHGSGNTTLVSQAAMPNPANGDIGSVLNADYGSGVIVKRIEGTGNGGNVIQLDDSSEQAALLTGAVAFPTYIPGSSPINVKVVDPVLVKPDDWELMINGTVSPTDTLHGIIGSTGSWTLQNTAHTVIFHSDTSLKFINEQLLTKYGISVTINQTTQPGDEQLLRDGYLGSDVTFADQGKSWLAGVPDGENRSPLNWIRSGKNVESTPSSGTPLPCDWNDYTNPALASDTTIQIYENMFPNNSFVNKSWAPFSLAAQAQSDATKNAACGFYVIPSGSTRTPLNVLSSVDLVFTSDKSKWTRCAVIEEQDAPELSENGATRFHLRRHLGWNLDMNSDGSIKYSTDPADSGMSWFPGYAINQETGERLNIVFGEDSYQGVNGGTDMLWNPTSNYFSDNGDVLFGGKHYIYISKTRYDEDSTFRTKLNGTIIDFRNTWKTFQWVGLPMLNSGYNLTSVSDGLIPTETRLRFRVTKPYAHYVPDPNALLLNGGLPYYTFSTKGLAPTAYADVVNQDNQHLLDNIMAVPNPYYGYVGYEQSRLDTRIRITNLPKRATLDIYSVDGTLVRRLEKDNANTAYIDWDLRNAKGLPIASGMYLIHVSMPNIGEKVIRWFGAMRPVDITTY